MKPNLKLLLVRARLEEIRAGKLGAGFASKAEKEGLVRLGYAKRTGKGGLALTDRGRKAVKIVMTGGAFDIIHLGHVHTLEKARAMGDALVVAVAHDATVRRSKGRTPIHTAKERAELLESLKCVDLALVGHPKDRMVTVRRVNPDIVVFGYDQKADMRLQAKVKRLKSRLGGAGFKTTNLIRDM
jgi:rfaE bifunctional protein nucleotidyltransferase chain/domain